MIKFSLIWYDLKSKQIWFHLKILSWPNQIPKDCRNLNWLSTHLNNYEPIVWIMENWCRASSARSWGYCNSHKYMAASLSLDFVPLNSPCGFWLPPIHVPHEHRNFVQVNTSIQKQSSRGRRGRTLSSPCFSHFSKDSVNSGTPSVIKEDLEQLF